MAEFHSVTTAGVFEGEDKTRQLNEVVCEHFLRQGMLDIAEQLNEVRKGSIHCVWCSGETFNLQKRCPNFFALRCTMLPV